jgi:hypothetical protein
MWSWGSIEVARSMDALGGWRDCGWRGLPSDKRLSAEAAFADPAVPYVEVTLDLLALDALGTLKGWVDDGHTLVRRALDRFFIGCPVRP